MAASCRPETGELVQQLEERGYDWIIEEALNPQGV